MRRRIFTALVVIEAIMVAAIAAGSIQANTATSYTPPPFPPEPSNVGPNALTAAQLARHSVDPYVEIDLAPGRPVSQKRLAWVSMADPDRVALDLWGTNDEVWAQARAWVARNRPGATLYVVPFSNDDFEASLPPAAPKPPG